jgi:hypothetical protein
LFKQLLATIQCAGERFFFLIKNFLDLLDALTELREDITLIPW